jgi:Fe-S cluster biogenesis protein NfuA/nitrite reductase/ring-hydroxylating ferredoxin subunit
MPQHKDVRSAGERVESLIGELHAVPDPRVGAAAEELVRTLVDLYGEGLAHVMHIAANSADSAKSADFGDDGGGGIVGQLIADPLVASLLLVHDLHPLDVDTRIQRALDDVRPYLGSHAGGVEYLGVDDEGVVRLKLEGSCHGCPSSTVTVRLAIEKAIQEAAPETVRVDVAGVVAEPSGPALLQIGRRAPDPAPPPTAATPSMDAVVEPDGWAHLPPWPAGGADARAVNLAGIPVLMCRVNGVVFAYRDSCPECAAPLSGGQLAGQSLQCAACGRHYDVRMAGAGLDDPGRHLEPLPLLVEGSGLRIAISAPVGSPA